MLLRIVGRNMLLRGLRRLLRLSMLRMGFGLTLLHLVHERVRHILIIGAIDTPLMRGVISNPAFMEHVLKTIPIGRIAQPIEVANFITYLLSDKASYITGNVSRVDGAWLAGPS